MALARRIRSYRPHLKDCIRTGPDKCKLHDREASWHAIVCRDGRIIQSIPFTRRAWHAGHPIKVGGLRWQNANHVSAGIEFEHAGPIDKAKKVWPPYTDQQKATWLALRDAMTAWTGARLLDVAHYEISPPGKGHHCDPGRDWMAFVRSV
jgi:N-acetyl-anhydromuramyl-L-alanine amidase AmpD